MWRLTFRFAYLLLIGLLGGVVSSVAATPEPEYLTVRNGLPQGYVNSMLQDQHGFIWLSTRDGLCRYDGVRFRIYAHDPQQAKSLSFSSLYEIKENNQGKIWVRTENNNIDCFDPVTEQSKRVSNTSWFRQALGRDQLAGIYPDYSGNVWAITQTNGFFRLNANGTVSHRYWERHGDTIQRAFHALLFDRQNRLWLAARDGLFRYDVRSGQFAGFRVAQGLPQNEVYALHERANGELLLGFSGRFAIFDPNSGRVRKVVTLPGNPANIPLFAQDSKGVDYVNQTRYTDQNGLVPLLISRTANLLNVMDSKLAHFTALSLLVDRTNVLWLGLNGDGVIKYDLNESLFQTWPYVGKFQTDWLTQQYNVPLAAIPAPILQQSAYDLRYRFDRSNTLWISSEKTVPYWYDAAQRRFMAVPPTGIEPRWLPPGEPFRLTTIATGNQGEIWGLLAPHNQAVVRYNPSQKNFTAFPLPLPNNNPYVVRDMIVDGGRVYLATKNHGLLQADLSTKRLLHWQSGGQGAGMLPDDALLCLAQDPVHYNYLWIGTFGRGLCQLDKLTGRIRQFSMSQGLPNNVIYAIRPDKSGHLWLSTNRGLCRFDTRTYEARNYTADDGLPSDEFNLLHEVTLPDGRLIFGGVNGYTIFDPKRIREDAFRPIVALTALRINNQQVNATMPGSPIREDINETHEIVLSHDQNFLSIDFAALEFNQSRKNQYRYKLTGLDNDWIYSGNQATATYTNLPPKTYTFVVNASNTSGIWSPYNHHLQVVIKPPMWATWWAYSGYALLLLGILVIYVRVRIRRMHQRSEMRLREQETSQLKHLDEVKSRFFANITHEFRTPLTLIITPLEEVLNETPNSPFHNRLGLVYRNAHRLLRLINELLDLAKLEAGSLTVTPTPADLPEFVERTMLIFTDEAQRKQIHLQHANHLSQPMYWFDSDKLEKILTNLLSNALKFTDERGSITVSMQSEPVISRLDAPEPVDLIQLSVHNTGPAIPPHNLPHVFDRFYQADQVADGPVSGTGIGLALAKELIEMMQGSISVQSDPILGTTFTVDIPCLQARTDPAQITIGDVAASDSVIRQGFAKPSSINQDAPWILLVEDNNDIAGYVMSVLSVEWQVQRASNGREGVEAALTNGPDLIISDVLMPELNGYELCRQLKANPATNHIPILLLTAKSAVDSRLEGFKAGADDYIAKPFQVDELRGRVRNRLEQLQRIRQYYRTQLLRQGNLPITSQDPEDAFMNRIYSILEARLDDPSFGVEPLALAMEMSRMHLNRKVKAMTGLTPVELIRMIRLKRAAELLLTGVSVSEVADRVGFDTPAYFSKVFKDQFHLTPSEYIDKNRHEMV
ncbi:ATP-binding protein [Spirosoma sp. KNUC1025]|uniref:ATP-binding protein n=1 Tax=Spirosoma sp. KNUC1025 TaxID=2894082 RepID=UPI00386E6900|nr:response regulator [Spirosoma sp. KNUC1025]